MRRNCDKLSLQTDIDFNDWIKLWFIFVYEIHTVCTSEFVISKKAFKVWKEFAETNDPLKK